MLVLSWLPHFEERQCDVEAARETARRMPAFPGPYSDCRHLSMAVTVKDASQVDNAVLFFKYASCQGR